MSNPPQIRFAGFTDAWEQRKLSEISEKVSKKNQDMVVDEVFTNSAEFGIISQRDYFDKDIANSENIDGYYIVEPNDFVYNPRISTLAPFGPVRRNKLDKSGAMSPLYYVFQTHDVDCGYLEYFFQTNRWHSFMHLNGNSGARSDRFAIRDEVFRDMPISMPQDIEEQKKVGDFFSTLELAITLHQRKCDALQKFKKSMLQKMFPQNGESVPEIRFAGFTDAWEQRELRTAATFSKGSGYSKNDLKENGTPIILYGRLYTKYETVISEVDTFVDVQPNSVYSTGHEVIVPASGETAEDISRASFVAKSGILLGGDLNIIVPDDYINPVFLALTISNGNQQKELSKRAQGKSVVHIHNSDLENVVLLYPKYEEQEKIGEYFSKLDSLITLHQRKLETLQKMKKSLLQKMFV